MPSKNLETFGSYAARALIQDKANGQTFNIVTLSNRLDDLLDAYGHLLPSDPIPEPPGTITAEAIYAAYPRKVGKVAAMKAIKAAMKGSNVVRVTPEFLLAAATNYAQNVATWPAKDLGFVPHPATWFNRGSYLDDPREWQAKAARTAATPETRDYRTI